MRKFQVACAIAAASLASACSGDGGSGAVVVPSPTPTPAPTASPAPTPTPTPTATPLSYVPFDQMNTTTLLFTANAYVHRAGFDSSTNHQVTAGPVLLDWKRDFAGRYRPEEQQFDWDYGSIWRPSDIVQTTPDMIKYSRSSGFPAWPIELVYYLPQIGGTRLNYVRPMRRVEIGRVSGTIGPVIMYGATGVPTQAADSLAGTLHYKFQVNGTVNFDNYDLAGSTGVGSIDPATGVMSIELTLVGTPRAGGPQVSFGTATGTASVAAIDVGFRGGTWSSPAQPVIRGARFGFTGAFFGPHGRELGGAFSIRLTSGDYAWGSFAGLQD